MQPVRIVQLKKMKKVFVIVEIRSVISIKVKNSNRIHAIVLVEQENDPVMMMKSVKLIWLVENRIYLLHYPVVETSIRNHKKNENNEFSPVIMVLENEISENSIIIPQTKKKNSSKYFLVIQNLEFPNKFHRRKRKIN